VAAATDTPAGDMYIRNSEFRTMIYVAAASTDTNPAISIIISKFHHSTHSIAVEGIPISK
jgi:hypothetical protein